MERVLVKAQNVRDYFVKHYEEHNWMDMRSFFCVKPPYQEMVITYDHDFYDREKNVFRRHVDVVVDERAPEYFSHYLIDEPTGAPKGWNPKLAEVGSAEIRRVVEAVNPRSFVEVKIFADLQQWPGRWFVMLDERGAVRTSGDFGYIYIRDPEETAMLARIPHFHGHSSDQLVTQSFGKHASIALATLQFMNCKNVEVVDNPPTRQQRRTAERAGRKPPVTYKTLVIHPTGKRRAQKDSHATGIEMSLHICRGHFKRYLDGPGLGKYHAHGVWWWTPQVRGKADVGRVVKDYEVK